VKHDPKTFEGRKALAHAALDAARAAGEGLRKGFRSRAVLDSVETKASNIDLVTMFDRASEEVVMKHLAPLGIPVVGEEGGHSGFAGAPAVFYVDPLDGTTNFVHGHPYHCVSIGLIVDGQPASGAVFAPALNVAWVGVVEGVEKAPDGYGIVARGRREAVREGTPVKVSETSTLIKSMIGTGFPYDVHTSTDNNLGTFVGMMRQVQAVRRCGSAAIDLCHVGEGTFDAFWERKLRPWDLAAGAALVLAAGGQLSSMEGGVLDVKEGHLIASNGRLHTAMIEALAKSRKLTV